ncbi:hypothetical protein B0T10DRAFT_469186 [Thelonectria olida]|uniref:C2 domain-containing protein n=1 Tax=Thelonectria olida TaxID=1576542 RepID=A0A9P9AZ55_9HYPO|nr:hypothetical protein B0T10DRAFT_469186 [Thelonectria olida]
MSPKAKSHPLNAAHTAGIFADLSVDGPIIGTLVAIVDRAKNLPNRKTIGKQDPYCAARLGKEARKTTTDVRGGQTPKWDQELRFSVHDSPDYYQLKISIFTDDKKTDLIGESWIDLRGIIIPGGGQSDVWQTLSCRGKYAGEIRIEITFYDTRPKPEKPATTKAKQATSEEGRGSLKQRTPVKRRPLPSDPITGEAPPSAPPAASPAGPAPLPSALPSAPEQTTPSRGPAQQSSRGNLIPKQSPLQAVEYKTPPSHRNRHADHSPLTSASKDYSTPTRGERPRGARSSMNPPHEPSPRHQETRNFSPKYAGHPQEQQMDQAYSAPPPDVYDAPPMEDARQYPAIEDERPPPPPAHRTRNNSGGQELVPRNGYDASPPKSSQPPMRHDVLRMEAHRHSMPVIPTVPSYPGRPTFRGYDTTPPSNLGQQQALTYDPSPRHSSYDANYDPHHRSMQPTVEDVPETPVSIPNNHRHSMSVSRLQQQDEMCFDDPSPAPLSLSRSTGSSFRGGDFSPSAPQEYEEQNPYQMVPVSQARAQDYDRRPSQDYNSQGRDYSRSPAYDQNSYQIVPATQSQSRDYSRSPGQDPNAYAMVPASGSFGRDISRSPGQISYHPHSSQGQHSNQRMELETRHIQSSNSHSMPGMPAALVPGLDSALSQEVTDGIYDNRRGRRPHSQSVSQSVSTPPRGRPRNESYPYQSYNETPDDSQRYAIQPYNRRAITYSGEPEPPVANARDVSPNPSPNPRRTSVSPNPQHLIRRKSVSPAPPPQETRRLSGIPFGPDSYDELNPSVSSKTPADCVTAENNKIITYDGREIDPSDHLPIESWAPEPEPKGKEAPPPEPRRLNGAQPLPPSTRRTPRAGRHSVSAANSPYYAADEPRTPVSAGRARLQKRLPASAGHSPAAVSPLGPTPDNYQDRQSPYSTTPTRTLPRAITWDHQNENRAPHYASGPPLPAKVPLPLMSGANGNGHELALLEEMQMIDIGTGRSRRRGGY